MKVIEIKNIDDFLIYDLHYSLTDGWNLGDGHTWIFETSEIESIKEKIVENFKKALDDFFDKNI